jgi:CheY-like chemotaxis protein
VSAGPLPARACSVLVVGGLAEGVGFVLRRGGYQVDRAADGAAALDRVRAGHPQVVVIALDPADEEADGWLTAARIRSDARRTRIIVVAPRGRIARDRAAALGYGVLAPGAAAPRILAEVARQARYRRARPGEVS